MDIGARTKASDFGVKTLRVKITVRSNMPQNALFSFIVVTCWLRHDSRRSRNHHLVCIDQLFLRDSAQLSNLGYNGHQSHQ